MDGWLVGVFATPCCCSPFLPLSTGPFSPPLSLCSLVVWCVGPHLLENSPLQQYLHQTPESVQLIKLSLSLFPLSLQAPSLLLSLSPYRSFQSQNDLHSAFSIQTWSAAAVNVMQPLLQQQQVLSSLSFSPSALLMLQHCNTATLATASLSLLMMFIVSEHFLNEGVSIFFQEIFRYSSSSSSSLEH